MNVSCRVGRGRSEDKVCVAKVFVIRVGNPCNSCVTLCANLEGSNLIGYILLDSGSSCFVTPFRDTMILPILIELQMNGIGGAHSKMVSPQILSFLDADGEYAVLHLQCVFLLETLPIPLFATGPCEQQGWGFSLNASSPCTTMPDGRCVTLFRDRVTGFHWMTERL